MAIVHRMIRRFRRSTEVRQIGSTFKQEYHDLVYKRETRIARNDESGFISRNTLTGITVAFSITLLLHQYPPAETTGSYYNGQATVPAARNALMAFPLGRVIM